VRKSLTSAGYGAIMQGVKSGNAFDIKDG